MRILVIESSPHKNGSSNLLAEHFIKGAKEAGHQITVRDAGHMEINPCRGCDSCGLSRGCIQKDDMKQIEKDLLDTDMAVFVTPIYYFGMSAQLKLVIDRFYGINSRLSGRNLKTALITAAWDSGDDVMPYLRVSTPVRFCSFSPGWECQKMAGKDVQPLNNYTRRFRPSSLKCTDKSGLDGLQASKCTVIKAEYPPHADRRKITFHSGKKRHFLVGADNIRIEQYEPCMYPWQ